MIVMFRMNHEEKDELMKKVKKMEKFSKEIKEVLQDCYEEDDEYEEEPIRMRGGSSRMRRTHMYPKGEY